MGEARKAYSKAYFDAYRRANSTIIARYARGYYRENQRRYAEEQRFLKEARMRLCWSQAAVAAAVGVSQATITRLETGALPLETFRKRDKLLAVLEVVV